MLRRKTGKSVNHDTLGPPLRVTDIEHYTPSQDAKNYMEDQENKLAMGDGRSLKPNLTTPLAPIELNIPVNSNSRKPPPSQAQCPVTHPCNSAHKTITAPPTMLQSSLTDGSFPEIMVGDKKLQKLSLLGRGGSSQVFKVFCNDGSLYALKEIYTKTAPSEIKAAYINEVKLLKKLKGKPQIITLHDFSWNQHEGILRLLLEHGEMDLGQLIRSRQSSRPLRDDPLLLTFLWQQMLNSVRIIHEEGIIHNDLKPDNFVCSGLQLKLIDFGIANKIEEEHTSIERDIRCGTANYMPPECIMTHDDEDYFKIGRPADVWSLGCILHQMVFHHTPFEHIKGKMQKFHAIIDPNFEIKLPDFASEHASDIIKRCLRRNPKERPTIEQLLHHEFITKHTI